MTLIRVGKDIVDVEQTLIALDRADCAESLATFIRMAWHVVEPTQPYVHGWHIDAICEHLEAISDGDTYNRLLVNVPPGMMKSLAVGVFWPAWEWGPLVKPNMRYLCASHNQDLAVRDSMKMRRLVTSEWYQQRWPHVRLTSDQNQKTKFENTATGFRQAAAAGSVTGARGDRVIIDDPHSVENAASDQQRQSTIEWFREAVPLRLNNPETSAIVVIMQRLHEEDVSGVILEQNLGYDSLILPMRYDPSRATPTRLGFSDPRTTEGELLFPARFPLETVIRDEKVLGPYAAAGQFQQLPAPRGGGIIKRDWWQTWMEDKYPPMSFIMASIDTAYTTKTENDFSAMTVWGVFTGAQTRYAGNWSGPDGTLMTHQGRMDSFDEGTQIRLMTELNGGDAPRVMMMHAWAERLELHDLVAKVAETCKRMKVNTLLIENKASGYSVAQEIRRLFGHEDWNVRLIDPRGQDKLARLYSVQHLFEEGMIYAPDKAWADMVIQQTSVFPKGKHADLVDSASMALRTMREMNLLTRDQEWAAEAQDALRHLTPARNAPIYPV